MRVLLVEPGRKPRAAEIGSSLEEMQEAVGGPTKEIRPWHDNAILVCRQNRDDPDLPANRALINQIEEGAEAIKGTFFICALKANGLTSLNRIQLEKYYLMFREPELILETEHGMCVFRCSEQVYAEAQNGIRNKEKQPKQKGEPQR